MGSLVAQATSGTNYMASIPLSEIPNAPVGGSPVLEQASSQGDATYRQIQSDIRQGAQDLTQNIQQVAEPGRAYEKLGAGIAQAGNDFGKIGGQVAEGIKVNSAATFANNYSIAKAQFDQSLQGTDPKTWAGKQIEFNQNYGQLLQGISPYGQMLLAPDIARKQALDVADIGIKAHVQQNNMDMYNQIYAIQNLVNAGDYKGATALNELGQKSGYFDPKAYIGQREYIEGSKQKGSITDWINANPHDAQEKIQWAIDANKQLPHYDKISVDELKSFKNISVQVADKQDGQAYKDLFAVVEDPKSRPQTIAQLTSDPRYQWLNDDKKQALQDQFLEKAKITDPSVVQAALDAKQKIHDFNPTNDPRPYQSEQQLYQMLAGVPKAQRAQLGGLIEDKMTSWIKGGGQLPADKVVDSQIKSEIVAMGKAGLLGGNSTDPVEIDRRTHDIENAFNSAWQDPKQKGNGSLQDARRIIDTLTQKNQWGAGASEGMQSKPAGGIWNWLKGTKPQASNDDGSAMGKVTSYGYSNDETPDSNTQAGKSAIGKLSPNSLAVSPDVEAKMKDQGIKIGDSVQLHLADGSTVTRIWDDRTAKQYKGKPLMGRFDFYSPNGLASQEGTQVVGFSKT